MAETDDEKGLGGARTRVENPESGRVSVDESGRDPDSGRRGDNLAQSVLAIATALDDNGEQLDLLTGSPDLDAEDLLSRAANSVTAQRKGPGRPKGAANRRNADVFDYLEALGHRDPAVTLSLIQSADVGELATALDCKKADAARLQIAAAKELLPYKYSKKPLAIDVKEQKLHMFITGDLNTGEFVADDGTLSIHGDAVEDAETQCAPFAREQNDEQDQ